MILQRMTVLQEGWMLWWRQTGWFAQARQQGAASSPAHYIRLAIGSTLHRKRKDGIAYYEMAI